MIKTVNAKNKRVLFISDQHFPYHHPDLFRFLKAIRTEYLTPYDIIINLGDEVDNHAISFHKSDVDLYSAGQELEKAIGNIQLLHEMFPKMHLLDSNHGSLAVRRFKADGLPLRYLKSMNEVYGVGKGWEWSEELIIETKQGPVYVCHGKTATIGKLVKEQGTYGAVSGHYHGKFCVNWFTSSIYERFEMFCGCLIDRDSMAFAYGKNHLPKPMIGLGMLSKTGYPRLIKMELNKKGRWTGKLP